MGGEPLPQAQGRAVSVNPLSVALPTEFVELVATRVAEILLEREVTSVDERAWPEWMSVVTAAQYLDMPLERLRKLKDRRAIPCHQEGPGCRLFFSRKELGAYMASLRLPGSALQ
jgi:hypothetical protein